VKVLALDYGAARTGLAVSDPTGILARPLGVVEQASTEEGIGRIIKIASSERIDLIVVGLPITLRGDRGEQAQETERFVELLRAAVDIPVETFDERFTTDLAESSPSRAEQDAVAAAHLLSGYLTWKTAQTT
jgi:putative Holliday junction resolvase